MSMEIARKYLEDKGVSDRIQEFDQSSATVELAAEAAGVIPARICKTLSFKTEDGALLVCTAGDTRIENKKFKARFGFKAKMLNPEQVLQYTNHEVGGVCPFGVDKSKAKVYADVSLKRFETVFPACGSSNSAVEMSPDELYEIAETLEWVDVCKDWQR